MEFGFDILKSILMVFVIILCFFILNVIFGSFFERFFVYDSSLQTYQVYAYAKIGLDNLLTWSAILIAGTIIFALFRLMVSVI